MAGLVVADPPSAHLAMRASTAGASPSLRFPAPMVAPVVAAVAAAVAAGVSMGRLAALRRVAATERAVTAAVHGIAAMTRMAT